MEYRTQEINKQYILRLYDYCMNDYNRQYYGLVENPSRCHNWDVANVWNFFTSFINDIDDPELKRFIHPLIVNMSNLMFDDDKDWEYQTESQHKFNDFWKYPTEQY